MLSASTMSELIEALISHQRRQIAIIILNTCTILLMISMQSIIHRFNLVGFGFTEMRSFYCCRNLDDVYGTVQISIRILVHQLCLSYKSVIIMSCVHSQRIRYHNTETYDQKPIIARYIIDYMTKPLHLRIYLLSFMVHGWVPTGSSLILKVGLHNLNQYI